MSISPPDSRDSAGSAVLDLQLRLSSTAPFIFSLDHHQTGAAAWFARPWTADDRFDFGALSFLLRRRGLPEIISGICGTTLSRASRLC